MFKEITLSESDVDLLKQNHIEIFGGLQVRNYTAGMTVAMHPTARFEALSRHPGKARMLNLGAFTYCNSAKPSLHFMWAGRFCSIAHDVEVFDGHHPIASASSSPFTTSPYYRDTLPLEFRHVGPKTVFRGSYGPCIVGNDVWIGAAVAIKAGVKVGDGAVIAGGSVVVKDVEPYAIMGGNPAKLIKYRFPAELIERLMAVKWWNLPISEVQKLDFRDPVKFASDCEALRSSGVGDGSYTAIILKDGALEIE